MNQNNELEPAPAKHTQGPLRNCKGEWIPNIENMEAMSQHIKDMLGVLKEFRSGLCWLIDDGGYDASDYEYENEEFKRILEASAKFMPNGK